MSIILPRQPITRRTVLGSGLVLTGAGLLTACIKQPSESTSTASTSGNPVRGGRLRIGLIGGGSSEVISPYTGPTMADHARTLQVYDTLFAFSPDLQTVVPKLAEKIEMSDGLKKMTLTIRQGVTFHDGQPLTSDDVVFNLQEWTAEANRNYSSFGNKYDPKTVRALDKYTVELVFNVPWAHPEGSLANTNCSIASKNKKEFNGTGPFKVKSFTPGKSSLMERNSDYWVEGKPYLDELEIISFTDNDSLVNAVKSGEVDGMAQVPFAQIPGFRQDPSFSVIEARSPNNSCFLVRTDVEPFKDPRARRAMKLLADRKQLVEVALLGHGDEGNDLFGPGLPFFDESVPVPSQDVDEAKSLLKAAGVGKQEITLHTAEVSAGMVESAVLFAEQINKTGLFTVKVKKEEPGAFYDPTQLWMKMAFTQTDCAPVLSLSQVYKGRTVVFNETHWEGPQRERFDALLTQADGSPDNLAAELWIEAQKIWREENGYIAWNSLRLIDVVASRVKGLEPHSAEPLSAYQFLNAWLEG